MRCRTVMKLLDDHVDGLLPGPRAFRVRQHLDGCDNCHAESMAAKAASASMAEWSDLELPPGGFEAIQHRIALLPPDIVRPVPEPRLLTGGRAAQWVLTGAMAAAAAILVGVNVHIDGISDPPRIRHFDTVKFSEQAKRLRPRPPIFLGFGRHIAIDGPDYIENDGLKHNRVIVPAGITPVNFLPPAEPPR